MYDEIEADGEAYALACKESKAAADLFLENLENRTSGRVPPDRRELTLGLLHGFAGFKRPRSRKSKHTLSKMHEELPVSFTHGDEDIQAMRAIVKCKWHAREDDILKRAASKAVAENENDKLPRGFWTNIAATWFMGTKTAGQCEARFDRVLNHEAKKGSWTPQEVRELVDAVDRQRNRGAKFHIVWHDVSEELTQKRTAWSCRAKWAKINANLEKRLGIPVVPLAQIRELLLTQEKQ